MKKIVVAVDVDGTLRCNCTETCQDINGRIVDLARILKRMKNVRLIAWSGGGAAYTQTFINSDPRLTTLFGNRCHSKLEYVREFGRPDLAIDDQQEFELGSVNLIVREK